MDGPDKVVDIREDAEQDKKGQEVMELLVAAGYFRARIKGLANFDKVVGGLVWCIETCEFDVDILLFQDDWSIGKKIALTEKVVGVLAQMNCPHLIEPHQIQGLDYIHIYPVIQWLVSQVLESRQSRGDAIRRYATWQFEQHFGQEQKPDVEGSKPGSCLADVYLPKRKFRQKTPNDDFTDKETRVSVTLLEYGQLKNIVGGTLKNDDTNNDDHFKESFVESQSDEGSKLNVRMVTNLINLQSVELHKAAVQYTQLKGQLDKFREVSSPAGLSNSITILENKKLNLESRLATLRAEMPELRDEQMEIRAKSETLSRQIQQLISVKEKEEEATSESDKALLEKLQFLVLKNESIKKKESDLKQACKTTMAELEDKNKALEKQLNITKGSDGSSEQKEISAYQAKLDQLRQDLAVKSRLVGKLERQLDDVPSRYELDQYQRRFFELDHQVAGEYSECQQFVTMYNSLIDQKTFMEREVMILNSVLDSTKQQLADQLGRLLQGVQMSRSRAEQMLKDQQVIQDSSNVELSSLLDEHRQYTLLVRDMKEEMKSNETLLEKIAAAQQLQ